MNKRLDVLVQENTTLREQLRQEWDKATIASKEAEARFKELEDQVRLRYEGEGSTLRDDVRILRETLERTTRVGSMPPETKFIVCFSVWVLVFTLAWAFSRDDGLEHKRATF